MAVSDECDSHLMGCSERPQSGRGAFPRRAWERGKASRNELCPTTYPCTFTVISPCWKGWTLPKALLARAAACGYAALALTDSNNLYGAVAFTEAARHHGVRPILGACLRHGRQRCTVLIAEPAGYASLCLVLSRLHLAPPPSLFDLLAMNAQGLHVLADDVEAAEHLLGAFGARLWLEVVRPPRSASRERTLLEWGLRHSIPPVASTAAHFATADGHEVFRLLTAVRQRMLLDALPARLPITPAHHLADAEQVHQRFRDLPEAIVNSGLLAGQCRSDVLPRGVVLPPPPVPAGLAPDTYLRGLCEDALRRRMWQDETTAQQRLEQELTIIAHRGLAGYFLVVREIAQEARRRGYPIALPRQCRQFAGLLPLANHRRGPAPLRPAAGTLPPCGPVRPARHRPRFRLENP